MIKRVESYKKTVGALTKLFMFLSMIFTMGLYSYNIALLTEG